MTSVHEGMMNKYEAQAYYQETAPKKEDTPTSELEATLRKNSIAAVDLGIDPNAFQELSDRYAVCIEEHADYLHQTAGNFDKDGVPEDGHVRKEISFNDAAMQISDPKNLFHFNNPLIERVAREEMLDGTPTEFREFMEQGIDLHRLLARKAKQLVETLDGSYERMGELYFPKGHPLGEVTFRLLRYDGYPMLDDDGRRVVINGEQVAKPHYDRGGMTIQAYASAPGFWIHPDPTDGSKRKPTTEKDKVYPPHGIGESQVFFGAQHRAVYDSSDPIRALYHGVDRIITDEAVDHMPSRTAAIAFIDAPLVDTKITGRDTQPDRVDQEKLDV